MADKDIAIHIPLDIGQAPNVDPERIDATKVLSFSNNSRLSTTRGRVEKAPGLSLVGSTALPDTVPICYGIVPDSDDASVAYFRPKHGHYRLNVADGVVDQVQSPVLDEDHQNAYFPVSVEGSGYAHAGTAMGAPAVVHYDNYRVYATLRDINNSLGCYVSVETSDGAPLYSTFLFTVTAWSAANPPWIGLTAHGANGVRLWYGIAGDLTHRKLVITDTSVSVAVGSTVAVWTSPNFTNYDICGDNDTYAWILARSDTTATSAKLWRYDVTTGVTSVLSFANWCTSSSIDCYFSVAHVDISGSSYLAVAASDSTSLCSYVLVNGYTTPMVARFAAVTGANFYTGRYLASGFYCVSSVAAERRAMFMFGTPVGAPRLAGNYPRTVMGAVDFATGAVSALVIPHMVPFGRANAWVANNGGGADTEVYPLFAMTRANHDGTAVAGYSWEDPPPTGTPFTYINYGVWDPAVAIVTVRYDAGRGWTVAPIARVAVDKVFVPAYCSISIAAMHVDSYGGVLLGLAELPVGQSVYTAAAAFFARVIRLNMSGALTGNGVASYAVSDGATVVGAAQPVHWDGVETVEQGLLWRPYIGGAVKAGPGVTGTFRVRAVYTYRDRHGRIHRSEPSGYVQLVLANQEADVRVTAPFSMRSGIAQEPVTVQLYSTDGSDQTRYYEVHWYPNAPLLSVGTWLWSSVALGLQTAVAIGTELATDGTSLGEFSPQAPPALYAIARIGERTWGISAEDRSVVWYSKLRPTTGWDVATEFSGFLTVRFPSDAGKLMGCADYNGTPVFFAENAVYVIDGSGVDNTGGGLEYAPPRLISSVGCTSRDTIVATPAGVLFAADCGHPAMVTGEGVRVFYEQRALGERGCTSILRASEAIWLDGYGDLALVYNWERDAWTSWDLYTRLVSLATTADGKPLAFESIDGGGTNQFVELKDDTHAPGAGFTGQMSFQTGWIQPAGPTGDVMFGEVWLRARHEGSHSLTITVEFDFTSAGSYSRTWTNAEIVAKKDALGNYTLLVQLGKQCRAIRISVMESLSTGWGVSPGAITVFHKPLSEQHRRALRDGSNK